MKIDTREHIVKTASHLFYNNGYNLTGINEIIAEAGIAKATLYNHFKSKEDICIAYLDYKNSSFLTNIAAYCNQQPKGEDRLLGIFDFLLAFFKGDDFNGCWCIRTVSEIPKDNQKVITEIQNHKNKFIKLIEQLITENLTVEHPEIISKQIYLLYESAVSESHLHREKWPIETTKSILVKLLT